MGRGGLILNLFVLDRAEVDVSAAIEDAENVHEIATYREGDTDTAAESHQAHARPKVFPQGAALGEGSKAEAVVPDAANKHGGAGCATVFDDIVGQLVQLAYGARVKGYAVFHR